jgi:hypothetical protein
MVAWPSAVAQHNAAQQWRYMYLVIGLDLFYLVEPLYKCWSLTHPLLTRPSAEQILTYLQRELPNCLFSFSSFPSKNPTFDVELGRGWIRPVGKLVIRKHCVEYTSPRNMIWQTRPELQRWDLDSLVHIIRSQVPK